MPAVSARYSRHCVPASLREARRQRRSRFGSVGVELAGTALKGCDVTLSGMRTTGDRLERSPRPEDRTRWGVVGTRTVRPGSAPRIHPTARRAPRVARLPGRPLRDARGRQLVGPVPRDLLRRGTPRSPHPERKRRPRSRRRGLAGCRSAGPRPAPRRLLGPGQHRRLHHRPAARSPLSYLRQRPDRAVRRHGAWLAGPHRHVRYHLLPHRVVHRGPWRDPARFQISLGWSGSGFDHRLGRRASTHRGVSRGVGKA